MIQALAARLARFHKQRRGRRRRPRHMTRDWCPFPRIVHCARRHEHACSGSSGMTAGEGPHGRPEPHEGSLPDVPYEAGRPRHHRHCSVAPRAVRPPIPFPRYQAPILLNVNLADGTPHSAFLSNLATQVAHGVLTATGTVNIPGQGRDTFTAVVRAADTSDTSVALTLDLGSLSSGPALPRDRRVAPAGQSAWRRPRHQLCVQPAHPSPLGAGP